MDVHSCLVMMTRPCGLGVKISTDCLGFSFFKKVLFLITIGRIFKPLTANMQSNVCHIQKCTVLMLILLAGGIKRNFPRIILDLLHERKIDKET